MRLLTVASRGNRLWLLVALLGAVALLQFWCLLEVCSPGIRPQTSQPLPPRDTRGRASPTPHRGQPRSPALFEPGEQFLLPDLVQGILRLEQEPDLRLTPDQARALLPLVDSLDEAMQQEFEDTASWMGRLAIRVSSVLTPEQLAFIRAHLEDDPPSLEVPAPRSERDPAVEALYYVLSRRAASTEGRRAGEPGAGP